MDQQFSITLYEQTHSPCLSNDAPNRMINLDSFLNFVNANLSSCKICKYSDVRLIESSRVGLASSFTLYCERCEEQYVKIKNQYSYHEIKYDEEKKKHVEAVVPRGKSDRRSYFE